MVSLGCYMACLDLKSFYHYLPLHPKLYCYFHFTDSHDGKVQHYKFVPFGMWNAPAYASAVSSEMAHMFWNVGIEQCLFYIDDCMYIFNGKC